MSVNQSRSDRGDYTHSKKSARSASSNQPRTSGAYVKGGAGTAPSPPINSNSSSAPFNRSFKKGNNAQGGQSRVNLPSPDSSNSTTAALNAPNGVHVQQQLHGKPNIPISSGSAAKPTEVAAGKPNIPVSSTSAAKPTELAATQQRSSSRALPKAPSSQPTTLSSDIGGPATPDKSRGSAPKGFALQFGSLSPSCMQIPARTSSAPPNLDEQKRDQARHESLKSGPSFSNAVPKQQGERKAEQLNVAEVQPVLKARRDAPVSIASPVSQTQKPSSLPILATTMQMQFHQPHVSAQFSGLNSQIQSQGVTGTSIPIPMPMPMPLSIGNSPQLQPQVFVQGLPHPMQSQGIMHHGQSHLGFTSQIGPQLTPNMGNIGIGINSQYPLQQGGKFVSPRKSTVKITHPQTHEELKLDPDVSPVQRSHLHPGVSHSQPIPTFGPSHSINYYTSNFNTSPVYFQFQNSSPVVGSKVTSTSQAPRSNYNASHVSQSVPFMNQNATLSVNKAGLASGPLNPEYARNVHSMISAPSETVQVRVKHVSGSTVEKLAESVPRRNSAAIGDRGLPKFSTPTGEGSTSHSQMDTEAWSGNSLHHPKPAVEVLVSKPAASKETEGVATSVAMESVPSVNHSEVRKENLRGGTVMDHEKNLGKSANVQAAYQVGGQSLSAVNLPLGVAEKNTASSYTGDSQGVETKGIGVSSSRSEILSRSIADKTPIHSACSTFVSESELAIARCDLASSFSEKSGDGSILRTMDTGRTNQLNDCSLHEQVGQEETGKGLPEGSKEDSDDFSLLATGTSESPVVAEEVIPKAACTSNHSLASETVQTSLDEDVNKKPGDTSDRDVSTYRKESTDFENSSGDSISILDASTTSSDNKSCEVSVTRPGMQDVQPDPHTTDITQPTSKYEGESVESSVFGITSLSISTTKDKSISELTRPKSSTSAKGKKKMKDLLLKADAAGTTSDLYMAYKGPEERMESSVVADNTDISVDVKQLGSDVQRGDGVESEKVVHNKAEPDDWEDAADISVLKFESPADAEKVSGSHYEEKKYSKDFLLQFADKCKDLPEGFESASDIAETLMSTAVNTFYPVNSHPSLGKGTDWQAGGPRNDRRVGGRDLHLDTGHGGNLGFRGQGGNFNGSRNTRAPVQHGGILSEPKQFIGTQQGGVSKNSPDSDRWHHTTNFHQKGLIPSPHTALQVMHRAERKYEVGKVTGEEQAKQRQLKAILNKLTPQNFEKLFEQVKAVNIDNAVTLIGVIAQIFDKALTEPTFCEMYADFCFHLSGEIPEFFEDNEKITFKRLLLNKCQEEFERGEREQEEANKGDEEGEVKLSKEEREEKKTKARRRMLGNIRLIGELYKKRMLTERIMHSCINKLLGHQCQNPDEEDVEALCKLMSTIGVMIDHPKAKEHIDAYFDMMEKLSTNMKLSSRVRFMLKDSIDLRRRKWQQRMKVEGPKKIDEVHRDAAQERQAQASRLARNPSMNPSRRPQMDFGPRGSNAVPSPNSQMGPAYRMFPSHNHRGFGGQDARSNEVRTPIPLPHRPTDDAITLGPQTSLGRGMSISSVSSDRIQREDVISRHALDRYAAPAANDHSSVVDHSMYNQNTRARGNGSEVSVITSPPPRGQQLNYAGNVLSEKVLTEAHLRDMSIAAIREFYSAHDEKEVSLCVKDLNSPSFHPSMISIWVSDSFERKDMERDLLARLLVNLTRPAAEAVVSQVQLMKGLESVLATLEDAVNDAPKAPQFLGRLFARMIVESVVPLREIGQLLYVGGEETGQLVDIGLAGDVLGGTLEIIKSEKGESVLNDLIAASNLRLEDFRSKRRSSKTLEKIILGNTK